MDQRETVGKVSIESKQCVSSLDLANLPIANHPPSSATATATGAGAATGAPVSGLCPLQC